MRSDAQMQDLLAEVTDALLAGEDIDSIHKRYGISREECEEMIQIVKDLNHTMVKMTPSPEFARRLKADLVGERRTGVMWRLQRLPAHVQMAAVAALFGGIMVFFRRRFLGDESATQNGQEEASPLR